MSERDIAGLLFTGDMYGVQLDQLAAWLGISPAGARAAASRWRERGHAESARLGPGPAWVWLTRDGLAACGLRYAAAGPALSRLAHLRAVTAVRLALESSSGYTAAGGYWRSERRLRARAGGRLPLRQHLPDGEVHWPESAPGAAPPGAAPPGAAPPGAAPPGAAPPGAAPPGSAPPGSAPPGPPAGPGWAGECWAVEAELTPKTVRRTVAIMTEILTRTGDYGCPAAEVAVPGRPPRHARVLYVCSAAARPVVHRARAALGGALAGRVEIRLLPDGAVLARGDDPPQPPAIHRLGENTPPAHLPSPADTRGDDPPQPPAIHRLAENTPPAHLPSPADTRGDDPPQPPAIHRLAENTPTAHLPSPADQRPTGGKRS